MTATLERFRLRDLIREVIVDHPDVVDPGDLASVVVDRIPEQHWREVLVHLLRDAVREVYRVDRGTVPVPRIGVTRAALVRDWYRSQIDGPVCVGDKWVRFGDCTASDLDQLIMARHAEARANEASALRYTAVRDEMLERGFTRVAELPETVFCEVYK